MSERVTKGEREWPNRRIAPIKCPRRPTAKNPRVLNSSLDSFECTADVEQQCNEPKITFGTERSGTFTGCPYIYDIKRSAKCEQLLDIYHLDFSHL